MKQKIAWILGVLIVLSLLATSLVLARPLSDDLMTSHFFTIPEGSTHTTYDGDYVSGDPTIDLYSGWSTNLPFNTCAIAARLAYKDGPVGNYAMLRPSASEAVAVQAIVQSEHNWITSSGIVPITDSGDLFLELSSNGYVYLEITGYWLCDEYIEVRPTLTPYGG